MIPNYLTCKYHFLTLYLSLKQVPILCSKTPPPWGGGLKISKPRGPMGWGIQNFKTPGTPWGGGFEIPWGIPNTISHALS